MGITFLMGFLFWAGAFFVSYNFEKRMGRQDKITKWAIGIGLVLTGVVTGENVSFNVGEKIAKKYLTSAPVTVLKTVDLLPFSGSSGAYIVTGENQRDEKVAWYLQEEGLWEKPYSEIVDKNSIVFTDATAPVKQLVKVNVGSFWKWFAFVPSTYRFVIPAGGLQEGNIVKTYKYIPKS